MTLEGRDPTARTDAQPKENEAEFSYFTEGKKLAEAGIFSEESGRGIGFFKTTEPSTIIGAVYTNTSSTEPTVEFSVLAEDFPTQDTAGILIYTLRVNEKNEFIDTTVSSMEDTLGGYMQRQVDKVYMLNLVQNLDDLPDGETGISAADRIEIDFNVLDLEKRPRLDRPLSIEAFRLKNRIVQLEGEFIRKVPTPKFVTLLQNLLTPINMQRDNVTPKPYPKS